MAKAKKKMFPEGESGSNVEGARQQVRQIWKCLAGWSVLTWQPLVGLNNCWTYFQQWLDCEGSDLINDSSIDWIEMDRLLEGGINCERCILFGGVPSRLFLSPSPFLTSPPNSFICLPCSPSPLTSFSFLAVIQPQIPPSMTPWFSWNKTMQPASPG